MSGADGCLFFASAWAGGSVVGGSGESSCFSQSSGGAAFTTRGAFHLAVLAHRVTVRADVVSLS